MEVNLKNSSEKFQN